MNGLYGNDPYVRQERATRQPMNLGGNQDPLGLTPTVGQPMALPSGGDQQYLTAPRETPVPQMSDYEKQVAEIDARNRQIEAMNQVLARAGDSTSMQNAVMSQYMDMYSPVQREQSLMEAQLLMQSPDPAQQQAGLEMLGQIIGVPQSSETPAQAALGDYYTNRFAQEFAYDPAAMGDPEVDAKNILAQQLAMEDPRIAEDYFRSENNPNFIEKLGGFGQALFQGGPSGTYDQIMKQKRLEKAQSAVTQPLFNQYQGL